jgi:ribosome biogenesis GTPase A
MAFTWFPGHMRKALRRIEADAVLVDLVLLLLDARAPATSRNATLEKTLLDRGKRLLFVLSKADMADPAVTQAWVRNLQRDGQDAVAVSGATGAGRAVLLQVLKAHHKELLDVARRRGIQHAVLRCMVVGVPNVGKSTLINKLSGSARAKTGKRPGVTRGPQWVPLADGIELLDTPGVMLPGRLGPESLLSLAVTGTIKEEVLPLQDLAPRLAELIQARGFGSHAFGDRPRPPEGGPWYEWLQALCRARGFLLPGSKLDERRAVLFLLKALRDGRWGPLTLERPEVDARISQVERPDLTAGSRRDASGRSRGGPLRARAPTRAPGWSRRDSADGR